jgi:hypothetical protein
MINNVRCPPDRVKGDEADARQKLLKQTGNLETLVSTGFGAGPLGFSWIGGLVFLGFPWILSSETLLFNGLRALSDENVFLASLPRN